jgi:hypothetical protein
MSPGIYGAVSSVPVSLCFPFGSLLEPPVDWCRSVYARWGLEGIEVPEAGQSHPSLAAVPSSP